MSTWAWLSILGVESVSVLPLQSQAPVLLGLFLRPRNFMLSSGQAVYSGAFNRATEPGEEMALAGGIQLFLIGMHKFCTLTPRKLPKLLAAFSSDLPQLEKRIH